MKLIKEVRVNIPNLDQTFELGDLTIFIGRPNSGKTRILTDIFSKSTQVASLVKRYRNNKNALMQSLSQIGVNTVEEIPEKGLIPKMIHAQRDKLVNINAYNSGFDKINQASMKMDPSIIEIGNNEVNQNGFDRPLNVQGSGMQNMVQIISQSLRENFILIDEPEISQFPNGKIEILRHILDLLDEKQVILATHDPTMINQYIIKKYLNNKEPKIIVYSFCNNRFHKIDFNSDLNPEIHCGYLSQTLSGKPKHLIFEGQTEFYAFQSLLPRYCIEEEKQNMPKILNEVGLSYLGGNQWKINIHHVPNPDLYDVLVIIDGDKRGEFDIDLLPASTKEINSIEEYSPNHINLMFLKADNIEKAFEGIYGEEFNLKKPFKLGENIWKDQRKIIDLLKNNSEESKQIYEVLEWAIKSKDN